MPRRRPRTRLQRDADRVTIARLYLAGRVQTEIAAELGLDQSQISRELRTIQEEWRQRYAAEIEALKARELARIDELERVAWDAWERSKVAKVEREQTDRPADDGRLIPAEATVVTTTSVGDTRYLDKVQWCIEQRCKILQIVQPAPAVNLVQATYVDTRGRATVEAILADPEAGRLAGEFMARLAQE